MEGVSKRTLPRAVPMYNAEKTAVLDKGAVVQLSVRGVKIKNVLLDGGSTINLMNEQTYRMIGKVRLVPTPFNLTMADQSTCHPLGYIPDLAISLT